VAMITDLFPFYRSNNSQLNLLKKDSSPVLSISSFELPKIRKPLH
jgi:hypothetical protein